MSSQFYRIQEHKLPAQHIRHYPFATLHEDEEVLTIAVKQYTPLDNPKPKKGDVTIIGAHANGFPKELYEPLWDDLLKQSKRQGWRIRSIWIADVAHQGYSSVYNEDKLGNEPGWFDHPRDLLHMINTFRMPRPMIGIGHSMGGNNLINLSLMHPRLLETLILIDPVIVPLTNHRADWAIAKASTVRRDRWPSRKVAAESFKKSKFYQAWDPRVLDCWIKHGLRELPSKLYPDPQPSPAATGSTVTTEPTVTPNVVANYEEKEVTLTTPKHQEVFSFIRAYHPPVAGEPPTRILHPENGIYADAGIDHPGTFYRPEPQITYTMLPYVRPSVLYIFGEHSDMCTEPLRRGKVDRTGTAGQGSGGVKAGKVEEVMIMDVGHLIAMEKVGETALHASNWITKRVDEWSRDEEVMRKYWENLPEEDKYMLNAEYIDGLGVGAKLKKQNGNGSKL